MNVLVVESPAKAKTINKYLGSDYKVLASFGHIRDLPSKDGSVKPDEDFSMVWEVDARAQAKIKDIAAAVKGADKLILATDPDREGEAIILAHTGSAQGEERAGQDCRSSGWCSTPSPKSRSWTPSLIPAPDQRRTGGCLSGAPRAGLSGGLHPVAGAVAQIAGRALGRPGATRGAAPGGGARDRRSKPSGLRNIGASTPMSRRKSGDFAARLIQLDGKKLEKLSLAQRGRRQARRRRDQGADFHHRQRRSQAGQAQSLAALHHLDPAAGSRAQAGLQRQAHHAGGAGPL